MPPAALSTLATRLLTTRRDCLRHVCADNIERYLIQMRQHVIERILDHIYLADGTPNKHWMMFAKRKFMGKTL